MALRSPVHGASHVVESFSQLIHCPLTALAFDSLYVQQEDRHFQDFALLDSCLQIFIGINEMLLGLGAVLDPCFEKIKHLLAALFHLLHSLVHQNLATIPDDAISAPDMLGFRPSPAHCSAERFIELGQTDCRFREL